MATFHSKGRKRENWLICVRLEGIKKEAMLKEVSRVCVTAAPLKVKVERQRITRKNRFRYIKLK